MSHAQDLSDCTMLSALLQAASELALIQAGENREDFTPMIREMISQAETLWGPMDQEVIDNFDEWTAPLIAEGFVDATQGYYEAPKIHTGQYRTIVITENG